MVIVRRKGTWPEPIRANIKKMFVFLRIFAGVQTSKRIDLYKEQVYRCGRNNNERIITMFVLILGHWPTNFSEGLALNYYGTRLSDNISIREPEGYLFCLNVPVARTVARILRQMPQLLRWTEEQAPLW